VQEVWAIATDVPVAWCICQSVCHAPAPCRGGWTDLGAVWDGDLWGPNFRDDKMCIFFAPVS